MKTHVLIAACGQIYSGYTHQNVKVCDTCIITASDENGMPYPIEGQVIEICYREEF